MVKLRTRLAPTALVCACIVAGGPSAHAQLWKQFGHPSSPHVDITNPDIEITVPELFSSSTLVVPRPTLVVLLQFSDLAPAAAHTVAFYQDMVFGTGTSGPWTSVRPSVAQSIRASSNGRFLLAPATIGDNVDGSADGIVGWVTAQCPPGVPGTCGFGYYAANIKKKRAEGIRRADPFFDYSIYDTDHDGVIESDELIVVVVNADNVCCDEHAAAGHGDPPGCGTCAGGNGRRTDPAQVPVDGGPPGGVVVHQLVSGLIEGAHANVFAHELGHQALGLGDLYAISSGACNPYHKVSDGYVCYPYVSCGSGCAKGTNDACASATCLEDGVAIWGSTVNSSGSDVSLCGTNDSEDVWFRYTPATTGDVLLSMCITGCQAGDPVFDTTLAVFDACGGNQLPGACNDDYDCDDDGSLGTSCDRASRLTVALTAGNTYWVRVSGYQQGEGDYRLTVQGGGGSCAYDAQRWYPPHPARLSLMGVYPEDMLNHLDPWAKIHLGFVKPLVVTHDGDYTLYGAETERSFALQDFEPEALVIYDPLQPAPYQQYFVLENRDLSNVTGTSTWDRGMATWLMDEQLVGGETKPNLRRAVRLIRRGGHQSNDFVALWDGVDDTQGYDLTATSTPRNTSWTDGSSSHVEITNISPAGPIMTFHVRMPPIFVDAGASPPWPDGSEDAPWTFFSSAVFAVAGQDLDGDGQQDGSRTIRLEAGSYTENLVVDVPCTLTAAGGSAIIGM